MGSINCKNLSSSTHDCSDGNDHKKPTDEYIEEAVCNVEDIPDNQMKAFDIGGDNRVLLVNQYGKLSALGPNCSHYGAPLVNGVLGDGHVKCPWHGACFNTKTGDIEDFPGLDSIPCHTVKVQNGKVIVRAKKSELENKKRTKKMVKRDQSNEKTFVIIGGGPAGGICAETLRQEKFTGRIIMVCQESALPYDRVKVTKAMNIELDKLELRTPEFYKDNSIDIMLGVSVTKINTDEKIIYCSTDGKIKYDKVFIATGSVPVRIAIPDSEFLENIMTIRNYTDAHKIEKLLCEPIDIVCLGSSFISLEAAAYCVKKAKSVTVIFRSDAPFKNSFGKDIGMQLKKLFEDNGVKMLGRTDIKKCIGKHGKITSIELKNDTIIPCDLLIMGTGGHPCTDFLTNSGVKINKNGTIDTDKYLMALNCPDIYIGGDIANAPVFSSHNKLAAIGHYQVAQYHGKIAAANMAGNIKELRTVPFFWTQLFNKNFRFAGHGIPFELAIKGKLEDYSFVVFFMDKEGYVISMASCGRDPVVSQFAEFLKQGRKLHKDEISENTYGWVKQLNQK